MNFPESNDVGAMSFMLTTNVMQACCEPATWPHIDTIAVELIWRNGPDRDWLMDMGIIKIQNLLLVRLLSNLEQYVYP